MGVVDKCISFFDESDHQKIIDMNGNLYVYTWFFDVPFCKSEDLFDFLSGCFQMIELMIFGLKRIGIVLSI